MDLTPHRDGTHPGPFISRLLNALLLRRDLYESVAADPSALRPAIAVICVSAVVQYSVFQSPMLVDLGSWALLLLILIALVRWLIYASIFYPFAKLFAQQERPFPRLLRCLGFAEAPAIMRVALLLVGAGAYPWVRVGVALWLLAASVVAVRAALCISLRRAIVISTTGFVLYLLPGVLLGI
jgi:hypothetical protein